MLGVVGSILSISEYRQLRRETQTTSKGRCTRIVIIENRPGYMGIVHSVVQHLVLVPNGNHKPSFRLTCLRCQEKAASHTNCAMHTLPVTSESHGRRR